MIGENHCMLKKATYIAYINLPVDKFHCKSISYAK